MCPKGFPFCVPFITESTTGNPLLYIFLSTDHEASFEEWLWVHKAENGEPIGSGRIDDQIVRMD